MPYAPILSLFALAWLGTVGPSVPLASYVLSLALTAASSFAMGSWISDIARSGAGTAKLLGGELPPDPTASSHDRLYPGIQHRSHQAIQVRVGLYGKGGQKRRRLRNLEAIASTSTRPNPGE